MGNINNSAMKAHNLRLLLHTLRKNGPAARSTLARVLKCTSPAVTNMANELLSQGVLLEGPSTDIPHGRKPILLQLNPTACYTLGMVLTTEAASAVLTDFTGQILQEKKVDITPLLGKDVILQTLLDCANACIARAKIDRSQLLGLGIAAPGPLNTRTGVMVNPPNFSDWHEVPICQIMEEALGIPAVLDKETNAAALAEYYFHDCQSEKTSFYVSLFHNSIGGSLLQDGAIHHGFEDGAGDIGHMQVDPSGPRCSCGHYGCLESVACGNAMLHQARMRIKSLGVRGEIYDADHLTLEQIFRYSQAHVPLFEELVDHSAQMVATAIGNVVTIISPSLVTIGGTLPALDPTFVDRVQTYIRQRPYPSSIQRIRIEPSVLGVDSCSIGAAMLALETFQLRLIHLK